MTQRNILAELDPFFHPRSVALIGASSREGKVGRMFMDRFLETGFQKLYPVNLRESEILGIKAYPAVTDIPGPIDLALILTPPAAVVGAIKECVAKGVKGIIINTAGFTMLAIGIGGGQFRRVITEAMSDIEKPLVVAVIMPLQSVLQDYKVLLGSGIPVYPDPGRAARALARLAEYAEFRRG